MAVELYDVDFTFGPVTVRYHLPIPISGRTVLTFLKYRNVEITATSAASGWCDNFGYSGYSSSVSAAHSFHLISY